MNAKTAVSLLTIYLVIYTILFAAGASFTLLAGLFLASPFMLIMTVYSVLKDRSFKYPDLPEGDEWGYLDKPKNELRMF